jgi:hydroxyacylglutathione hydrolase
LSAGAGEGLLDDSRLPSRATLNSFIPAMHPLPLEDFSQDVVGKAMRGTKVTAGEVAAKAGVQVSEVEAAAEGEFNAPVLRKIAPVLGLDAQALVSLAEKSYVPHAVELEGLAQFNTPWEDMTVNNYLVWDPATKEAVAFDSGADAGPLLAEAEKRGLQIVLILLTHTHGDHIFDLDRLKEKTGALAFVGEREPTEGAEPFAAGKRFEVGGLKIESRLTWGHSKGGITYVVHGLAKPVAVVGDAIFAGSMGGGGISYADALATNEKEIFSLPDETVICPGHGPLTTVGEEKRHNPFFAGRV